MALQVIGAGLGRTGTLSLKLALEHIGFGKCYHMSEMISQVRAHAPLWVESAKGNPQWDTIFEGYHSSTDYPGCMFWRELADYYPEAKIILTTRSADGWFESVSETVMSPGHRAMFEGDPLMQEFFRLTVFESGLDDRLGNREKMVEYFDDWNQAVIDEVPPERLLVYQAKEGWEPLCAFLGVPVPPEPYPRVNSREEMVQNQQEGHAPSGPPTSEQLELRVQDYLAHLKEKAFPTTA